MESGYTNDRDLQHVQNIVMRRSRGNLFVEMDDFVAGIQRQRGLSSMDAWKACHVRYSRRAAIALATNDLAAAQDAAEIAVEALRQVNIFADHERYRHAADAAGVVIPSRSRVVQRRV